MARLKIAYIGGGSTRAAGTMASFIEQGANFAGSEIVLIDLDAERLELIRGLAERMAAAKGVDLTASATTDRRAGLDGCDAILTSYRPGGFEARVHDERIPLTHGVIGQETQGPGGFFMALRSIHVMRQILDDVAVACPEARIFNYTNPVNIVAQAVTDHSDVPFVSLCEGPIIYAEEAARAAGLDPEQLDVQSVGLNHASWSVRHRYDGQDLLPLLAEASERRDLKPQTRRMLRLASVMGALGSEYFQYYYFEDEVLGELTAKPTTRAEDILGWVPDYWEHYVEQAAQRHAGRSTPTGRAAGSTSSSWRSTAWTPSTTTAARRCRSTSPTRARSRGSRTRSSSRRSATATPPACGRCRCRAYPPTCAASSRRSASTSRPPPTPPGRATRATACGRWPRIRSCARSTWPSGCTASWPAAHRDYLPARLVP